MNINAVYHAYLKQKESERPRDEKVFHASSAGSCYRKQMYSINNFPSDEKDEKSYRLLRLGTIVHKDLEKALSLYKEKLDKMQLKNAPIQRNIHIEEKVSIKDFNVVGTFDAGESINDGVTVHFNLYDFKTVAAYSWQGMFGRINNRRPVSPNYKLQLATYAIGIHEKYNNVDKIDMFLLYYNKNTSLTKQVQVEYSKWVSEAMEYWAELDDIANNTIDFEEDLVPEITYGVPFQDWECSYCQYASICPSKLTKKR